MAFHSPTPEDGRSAAIQREREAWAKGWLAVALSKLKDDVWWVEVETVDATPDTRLRQIEETANGNVINTHNIELCDNFGAALDKEHVYGALFDIDQLDANRLLRTVALALC